MSEPNDSHTQLDDALAAFAAAQDGSQPPTVEAFLATVPHLADHLRPLLATVAAADQLGEQATTPASPDPPAPPPARIDRYLLGRVIGRGGMAVVYEAEDEQLRRRVALKVARHLDPAGRDTWLREARIASSFQHPRIIPVYHVGEADGVAFIAMPVIDGRPLSQEIADRRTAGGVDADGNTPVAVDATTARQVAEWGVQAAEALAHVHAAGVLHRDNKPSNLMLDRAGQVLLTDFGLARNPKLSDHTFGGVVGTLRYSSPEQAAGKPIDRRADVYSLGVTLYELLTLRPAFAGSDVGLAARVAEVEPPPVRTLAPAAPPDLARVIQTAMAKRPEDRYASADELLADLKRFLAGEAVRAKGVSWVKRAGRWAGERWAVLTAVALTTVAVAAVAGWREYAKEVQAREELEKREAILRELLSEVNKSELVFRHLPQGQAEHRRLVGALKEVVCKWADEPNATTEAKTEAVRACLRLGQVNSNSGLNDDALPAYTESLDRVTALRDSGPDSPTLRFLAAEANKYLAGRYAVQARWAEAKAAGTAADDLYQGLIAKDGERANYRNPLSLLYGILANIAQAEGRPAERVAWIRKGLESDQWLADKYPNGHPQSYIRLACTWERLGDALLATGDTKEAEGAFRQAVANDEKLRSPEFAHEPKTIRENTCGMPLCLVAHLLAVGKLDEAGAILTAAAPDVEALAGEFTDRYRFTHLHPTAHYLLGQWHYLSGRPMEAKASFRRAIDLSRQIASVPPTARAKYHLFQPFPDLIDRRIAGEEVAAIEKESPNADRRWWRLAQAVGVGDRDGVTAALGANRQPALRPDHARTCGSLEAVYLDRIGDTTAAKAALPPPGVEVDGWPAICRKIVTEAK